ncbi:hypothetical protein ES703_93810 [subsurface metagenome]
MKSTTYSEKVLDHFRNPRNMGEIEIPDDMGKVGNPVCGDLMWIYIKVGKNEKGEEIIEVATAEPQPNVLNLISSIISSPFSFLPTLI